MHYSVRSSLIDTPFPPISEVRSWVEKRAGAGLPLVDLCQAVPSYPPSPSLTEFITSRISDPLIARYTPDEGLEEVRHAVVASLRRQYGSGPESADICMTIGASQAFWLVQHALCQPGDEVVVQLPCYFDHLMGLQASGVRVVPLSFREDTAGIPDPDEVAGAINARTRAILLVSPSNPTGVTIPPEILMRIYLIAREHGIALILDETYHRFLPVGSPPHTIFDDPEWRQTFIGLLSYGKTLAMTGYRSGAVVASPELVYHLLKLQDAMVVCQPRITQEATAFGLTHLDAWIEGNRQMMIRRHDRFVERFNQKTDSFRIVASGGFFAWVWHPFTGKTGREVAQLLVERCGVALLPGEVFGPGMETYLRLAFGNLPDTSIDEAVERFLSFRE